MAIVDVNKQTGEFPVAVKYAWSSDTFVTKVDNRVSDPSGIVRQAIRNTIRCAGNPDHVSIEVLVTEIAAKFDERGIERPDAKPSRVCVMGWYRPVRCCPATTMLSTRRVKPEEVYIPGD